MAPASRVAVLGVLVAAGVSLPAYAGGVPGQFDYYTLALSWSPTYCADTGKAKRHSAIDGRTTHHPGYGVSQKKRKRIEEIVGWLKTVAGLRQSKCRGLERVGRRFTFALAAYNLIRMPRLLAEAEP